MTGLGVSFQPGTADLERRREESRESRGTARGVQEAIKIMSLRLPKVVGAQALAPSLLLTSPGSAGSPDVDRIVGKVLGKFFPTSSAAPAAPTAPMVQPPDVSNTMPVSPPVRFDGLRREQPSIDRHHPDVFAPVPPAPPRIIPGDQPEPPTESPWQPPRPPSPPSDGTDPNVFEYLAQRFAL